jgi:hypothetical protein
MSATGQKRKSGKHLAARFDFHYYRPMDCYLSKEGLADAKRFDSLTLYRGDAVALLGRRGRPGAAPFCSRALAAGPSDR